MNFAAAERAAFCETLRSVSPDAPTLCDGWDAHTLAAHVWLRENDLGLMANTAVQRKAAVDQKLAETVATVPYTSLINLIDAGPTGITPFRIPGVDRAANLMEFYVHNEDVRRAGTHPLPPRVLSDELEAALWNTLGKAKRMFFRKAPFGVIVATGTGRSFAVGKDFEATLVGRPSELLLYATGRTGVAQIEIKAEPLAAQRLAGSLGL